MWGKQKIKAKKLKKKELIIFSYSNFTTDKDHLKVIFTMKKNIMYNHFSSFSFQTNNEKIFTCKYEQSS